MVFNSTDFPFKSDKPNGGQGSHTLGNLTYRIHQLKKQIQAERVVSIREKIEENKKHVETQAWKLIELSASREDVSISMEDGVGKMLSARIESPLCKVDGVAQDLLSGEEALSPTTVKLPLVEKIPPYTTWVFLHRNQGMVEEQLVSEKKLIYYDPHDSEALIGSDSEEEIAETEKGKHYVFSDAEDHILWMTFSEYGLDEEVLKLLVQFVGGTPKEIQDRCNMIASQKQNLRDSEKCESEESALLEKRLSAALDTFDNLFCRRCLVFDCGLHGCGQILINSIERQSYSSDTREERKPCGEQCHLQLRVIENLPEGLEESSFRGSENKTSAEDCRILITPSSGEAEHNHETGRKRKVLEPLNTMVDPVCCNLLGSCSKKLKPVVQNASVNTAVEDGILVDHGPSILSKDVEFVGADEYQTVNNATDKFGCLTNSFRDKIKLGEREYMKENLKLKQTSDSKEISEWKPLEKELFLKGIEIFGRNSCLIARNLLPGLKTCAEVFSYMNDIEAATSHGGDVNHMEGKRAARSRLFGRKRGRRSRKVKYSRKSAGYPSMWRRIAGKDEFSKHYTPCECQGNCGKQCPCLLSGTTCEKYCGCLKSCKNRFRGCQCEKIRCQSRKCPCFAAGRECDPDVCRSCWISCGDGSWTEPKPPRPGDGRCANMRLLLRQQKGILLAKSDLTGWGAFLKNSVNKNDFLGEYTGEMITHREADRRGKVYDRSNSSFLFNLDDQYVLDAHRKGDKLKFANHSYKPNCYAQLFFVAGDYRVGIFANERIEAGEEIFYDYRFPAEQAPVWARKPESSKRGDSPVPQGRAKKHQAH